MTIQQNLACKMAFAVDIHVHTCALGQPWSIVMVVIPRFTHFHSNCLPGNLMAIPVLHAALCVVLVTAFDDLHEYTYMCPLSTFTSTLVASFSSHFSSVPTSSRSLRKMLIHLPPSRLSLCLLSTICINQSRMIP